MDSLKASKTTKECSWCGQENAAEAAFCGGCGTSLERMNARVEQNRKEGNPTFGLKMLGVLLGLLALAGIAVLIVGICGLFLL